ncbi:hypothetical protein Cgig2_001060 [Carnegiea gigantea]|uniref:Uncharacterized protein n=1 Tax=Carnegiea gigantea TaxID=171969 RepID=A0A9Q1GRA8_9CARY|nr:hypothetical protein Cgig2_001060 [Carnegiea gigantea]
MYTQQAAARNDLLQAQSQLHHVASQQQSKAEWISFEDEFTGHDQRVEGFEAVSTVMTNFYKKLLGEKDHHRTQVDTQSNIVFGGDCLHIQQECLNITGFTEGQLPFRYLGMPITASRLIKGECSMLAEKSQQKSKYGPPDISHMLGDWCWSILTIWYAQVFILPQDVVNQGGNENYQKTLYIAWEKLCAPKKQGRLGIKNLQNWNMACIAELVWAIA